MALTSGLCSQLMRWAVLGLAASCLAACDDNISAGRGSSPIPPETLALMEQKHTTRNAPVLIRTYKKEAELEIWKMKGDGQYTLLKTFPMCRWSGQLGPKVKEGDRQVPEGFYTITPGQMNPRSNYYLSFNVGYPNAYDKAHGYSGGLIMVHGACSSAGCFSMTDNQIAEIYALAREAFNGGQKAIQMQSMPFRMTAENLAKHRADPNIAFWKELKKGSDNFEVTKQEPVVGVCNRRYVFNSVPENSSQRLDPAGVCPPLMQDQDLARELAAKERKDNMEIAELVGKGVKPVRLVYEDGGQHPDFASKFDRVSRPDALAAGPVEIVLDEKNPQKPIAVQVAAARAQALANAGVVADPAHPVSAETTAAISKVQTSSSAALQPSNVQAYSASAPTLASTTSSPASGLLVSPGIGGQASSVPVPEPPVAAPMFGVSSATSAIGSWFGMSKPEQAPEIRVIEPATPQPADVPLPPTRKTAGAQPTKPSNPAVKLSPSASLEPLKGAATPLPTGFMAMAPTAFQ